MTGRRTLATWLLARLPRHDDDTGSLAVALMAILVGAMVGALMLPMILTQSRATRLDISRVRALHAAQAGIDVLLGQIRASSTTDSDGNVWGNSAALPCWTPSSPLTGSANGTGTGQYSVSITYWATLPSSTGQPMKCAPGYGTYDPVLKTATPRYAVIDATGTDGSIASGNTKGRSIETTYVFQTDDTNIPGGLIKLFPDSSGNQWCMDAGSSTPTVGTAVVLRACSMSTPPIAQQVFAYRSDLSIQLVSSVTSANPAGLCIDTSPTAHASGVSLVLNTCAFVNPAKCTVITSCSPYNQQWSVNDNGHLEGAKSDQSSTDGYCINAQRPGHRDRAGADRMRRRHHRHRADLGALADRRRRHGRRGQQPARELQAVRDLPRRHGPGPQRGVPDPLHLQAEPEPEQRGLEPEVHPLARAGRRPRPPCC